MFVPSSPTKTPKTPKTTTTEPLVVKTNTPSIHSALTVINITNFIKITLDIVKSHYNIWSELFKIHAQAYEVIDHILPPSMTDDLSSPSSLKETDPALWKRALMLLFCNGSMEPSLLTFTIP